MRVDAGVSASTTVRRSPPTAASSGQATSFAQALAGARKDGAAQIDFTRMSRQEMRDWVNTQIRSGGMSLDEGRPFMAMTMKVAVQADPAGEVPASADGTRADFMQKARDGIQGALSRHDETTLKMLQSALLTMQRYQGQAAGVDTLA
jgi:hypothetical protein